MESKREYLLDLAYRLAPELRQRPLYVVTAGELGTNPTAQGIGGCVGVANDLACRDVIGERWRGRGWCVVLRDFEDREGVWLHELAHVLDGNLVWTEISPATEEILAPLVRGDLHEDFVKQSATAIGVPAHDHWHGAPFHRALIHLWYRAQWIGLHLCWRELAPLSRCPMYLLRESLAEELRRGRGMEFSKIMARPMPRRYRKFWNRRHLLAERSATAAA